MLVVTCHVASVDRVYDARPATISSTLVNGLQTESTGKVAAMVILSVNQNNCELEMTRR